MLATLRIKNLALVTDLTLDLQPGCNAITGETGAGKSIIIGALNLVLGERADRTLVRSGSDSCTVEAVFHAANLPAALRPFLEENGLEPPEDGQLVLKRTFSVSGSNRQFVNGSPTSLQTLATLGEWLVDMHGPHDHQSLLHAPKQLAILDAFGNLQPLRERFAKLVRHHRDLEAEKSSLIVDEKTYAQQLDLLRHQVSEITSARLLPDEETQVEQEYHRASNAARLLQLSQSAQAILSEDENAVLIQIGALGRVLKELEKIDPGASSLAGLHEQSLSGLQDLQTELTRYADSVELDPERLEELEQRLNTLQSLKRKYGANLQAVIEFGDEASRKLQSLEQRDAELARINAAIEKTRSQIQKTGQELSEQRRKLIPKLSKAVTKQLADLGFKQSYFNALLTANESPERWSESGLDSIEFQFAPNAGEPPRPLRAIASSGELARVMLALKTVLAAEDEIPVLVFDEADANVGGETARSVGEKMSQIANKRQVICITHLAPVAARASSHFVVSKEVKDGRTVSEIRLLSQEDRVTELARMLGGQSEAARKHAIELLGAE